MGTASHKHFLMSYQSKIIFQSKIDNFFVIDNCMWPCSTARETKDATKKQQCPEAFYQNTFQLFRY